jgi:hypothetical protein
MKALRRALPLVKRAWVVVIFGGVLLYLARNASQVAEHLRLISLPRIGAAAFLLLVSKLLLVELSRRSVTLVGRSVPYRRMFYINALSQLAKYLPGGVWHFAGRAAYYRADAIPLAQTLQAMIAENLWLVGAAGFVGLASLSLWVLDGLRVAVVLVGLAALWAAALWGIRRWRGVPAHWREIAAGFMLQGSAWVLIGASLWVMLPDAPLALGVSAFCLSWVIGYVTIVAPGGLGVREAILTALLADALSADAALVYAGVNRLLWVTVEVALGLAAIGLAQRAGVKER